MLLVLIDIGKLSLPPFLSPPPLSLSLPPYPSLFSLSLLPSHSIPPPFPPSTPISSSPSLPLSFILSPPLSLCLPPYPSISRPPSFSLCLLIPLSPAPPSLPLYRSLSSSLFSPSLSLSLPPLSLPLSLTLSLPLPLSLSLSLTSLSLSDS